MPAHISLSIHNTEKLSFLGDNFISAFYQGMYIISRSCQKKFWIYRVATIFFGLSRNWDNSAAYILIKLMSCAWTESFRMHRNADFTEVLCDLCYNLWNILTSPLWMWLFSMLLILNYLCLLLFPGILCQWYSCREFISLPVLKSNFPSSFSLQVIIFYFTLNFYHWDGKVSQLLIWYTM